MARSPVRKAIFEALKTAAPRTFDAELRNAFLERDTDLRLADLELDSLGQMEFCIAIELSTGVTLLPSQLAELGSTGAIERRIREAMASGDTVDR